MPTSNDPAVAEIGAVSHARELVPSEKTTESSCCIAPGGLTPTPATPDYIEMQSLLRSLVTLARDCFSCHKSCVRLYGRYNRIQSRIVRLFDKSAGYDFLHAGTYVYCLEMKQLTGIIELNVRNDPSFCFEQITWPKTNLKPEEYYAMRKAVCVDIDSLLWRGTELDFTRWNLEEVDCK